MMDKETSHESPLGRALLFGSSKTGTGHWLKIQLSAAALIPLTLYLLTTFTTHVVFGEGYASALEWVKNPINGIALIVTVPLGIYYCFSEYVNNGLFEDYVHHPVLNRLGITAVTFSGFVLASVGIISILKIMLGA